MPKSHYTEFCKNLNKVIVPEYNPISDIFDRYRKAHKMTLEDIAGELDVTGQNVGHMLKRQPELWTIKEIELYAKAVKCPLSEVYGALSERGSKHGNR